VTAEVAGYVYDENKKLTPEDSKECIFLGYLKDSLKVYVQFYVIC